MAKTLKPGQFYTYNGKVYRLKRRMDGCKGCALRNPIVCPGVKDSKTGSQIIDCQLYNVIFTV